MQTIMSKSGTLCMRVSHATETLRDKVLRGFRDEELREREEGSSTVEYAIGAVAAAGFAGLLLVILKSGAVKTLLEGIIKQALSL